VCNGDEHIFTWSNSSTDGVPPDGLRCACGAQIIRHDRIRDAEIELLNTMLRASR
jgi:hypothetical protein